MPILHIRNRGTERLNDLSMVMPKVSGESGLEFRQLLLDPDLVTSVLKCFSLLSVCLFKKEG